ncbi:MAG: ABC transporter permease [Nanoarchaeota archaeon]|nr:ABC transporter permease [Nanoarchaeota archaeon]
MIGDYFKIAFRNLQHRKTRTWLTMIGIFIGIMAVVALISLGQGLQVMINEQFEALGTNKLIIMPKGMYGPGGETSTVTFTQSDYDAVKKVKGVSEAAYFTFQNTKAEFKGDVRYSYAMSMPSTSEGIRLVKEMIGSVETIEGRDLKKNDKYKVLIGNDLAFKKVFPNPINVGDKVLINEKEFKVIGIWEKIGSPVDDQTFYIPEEAFEEIFDIGDRVDYIFAEVSDQNNINKIARDVEETLRKNRGLDEGKEDFEVQTPEEMLETYGNILLIVQIVLVGIASISLIVGGIGIMNTMYTSVLERTKEIGIMKSIGAKNSDIQKLFLVESGVLGMVGGIVGVLLGMGISKMVEIIARAFLGTGMLLRAYFPWYLIVGALAFSFIVGVLSGVLPARQAAKLQPVDSLRYE